MKFDNHFLDTLTEKAKASPRLRMHYDLRDTTEDPCMRMLNALEPGTVVSIHRHSETSEDVICIRGCVEFKNGKYDLATMEIFTTTLVNGKYSL